MISPWTPPSKATRRSDSELSRQILDNLLTILAALLAVRLLGRY